MEPRGEKPGEADGVRVTPQLLKSRSGEFALESILLLKLRGLGLVDLGCLGECLGLEWLDLSGNALTQLGPLASLRQLAVLNVANNRNPLCASPTYGAAVQELLPGLKAIDGERVSGRGSDFYQLCRDLDSSLRPSSGPGPRAREAQPWVEPGYWESWPTPSSAILEEACRQFQATLQECRDLDRQAGDSLAQAERVLGPAGTTSSFVF
nr:leucine-rich repeat-containing protein 61 [Vicugna pacos]